MILLYLFLPILLAIIVFILGEGLRRRISPMLAIIFSVWLFIHIEKITRDPGYMFPALHLTYPIYCIIVFSVLFPIEWLTWRIKDKGYRRWWSLPLGFLILVLACVRYPVIPHHVLVFLDTSATAKMTFHVTDFEGRDVPDASFQVTFSSDFLLLNTSTSRNGKTDKSGIFSAKGKTDYAVHYNVEKKGYYSTYGVQKLNQQYGDNIKNGKWIPWNPTVEVTLIEIRKKQNPVPLYAKELFIELPDGDGGFAYDFFVGDLMPPHGIGIVTDVVFQVETTISEKYNIKGLKGEMLFFGGNGIQAFSVDEKFTDRRMQLLPFHAPETGYHSILSEANGDIKEGQVLTGYFFKIRVADDGKDGCYGMIRTRIEFSYPNRPCIKFTYLLNPDQTTNLEFDGKTLMKRFGKYEHRVYHP